MYILASSSLSYYSCSATVQKFHICFSATLLIFILTASLDNTLLKVLNKIIFKKKDANK